MISVSLLVNFFFIRESNDDSSSSKKANSGTNNANSPVVSGEESTNIEIKFKKICKDFIASGKLEQGEIAIPFSQNKNKYAAKFDDMVELFVIVLQLFPLQFASASHIFDMLI